MIPNNFQSSFNELDNISFSAKNLVVNDVKEYKQRISQIPKNVISYVKRHEDTLVFVSFTSGIIATVGGLSYAGSMYPENAATGALIAGAGILTAYVSTLASVFMEKLKG